MKNKKSNTFLENSNINILKNPINKLGEKNEKNEKIPQRNFRSRRRRIYSSVWRSYCYCPTCINNIQIIHEHQ